MSKAAGRIDSLKLVQVIRAEVIRGEGTEENPVRRVIAWAETSGALKRGTTKPTAHELRARLETCGCRCCRHAMNLLFPEEI